MDCLRLYILTGAEMILLFPVDDKDGEGRKEPIFYYLTISFRRDHRM